MLQKLRQWISGPPTDGRDALASLILAARADDSFRAQLVTVLRLPQSQRGPLISTALEQMAIRGEPAVAREAFRILATDEGAKQALQALDSA